MWAMNENAEQEKYNIYPPPPLNENLWRKIDRLSWKNRKIVVSSEIAMRSDLWGLLDEGYTAGDIARALGINARAIRRLCSRNAPGDEIITMDIKEVRRKLKRTA